MRVNKKQWFTLYPSIMSVYLIFLFLTIELLLNSVHGYRGDDFRIDNGKFFQEVTCAFESDKLAGECYCPQFHEKFDSFGCKCKSKQFKEQQYICSCDMKIFSVGEDLHGCKCVNLERTIHNLTCTKWSAKFSKKNNGTILLGVLLPFSLGLNEMTAYYSANFYASAMFLAIDDVNNNPDLLPNHRLELVWADTKCDWKKTIQLQIDMMKDQNVDAFIGGGCQACEATARNAGAENIPLISHVSYCSFYFIEFAIAFQSIFIHYLSISLNFTLHFKLVVTLLFLFITWKLWYKNILLD